MATNFSLTLRLLEDQPDDAVTRWGRSFDWTIPEIDQAVFGHSDLDRARRTLSPKMPGEILMREGSARLKRLLLHPDLFPAEIPFCDGTEVQMQNRPTHTKELWNNVWATAWAMGDAESIAALRSVMPPDTVGVPALKDRKAFLAQWARSGRAEDLPVLLDCFREVVRAVPDFRAMPRRQTVEKAVVFWMNFTCEHHALSHERQEWVHALDALLPDAVRQYNVIRAAFAEGRFDLARNLAQKSSPDVIADLEKDQDPWLKPAQQAWCRNALSREREWSDAEACDRAEWLAVFSGKGVFRPEIVHQLHALALPHVAQWQPRWMGLLHRAGVPLNHEEAVQLFRSAPDTVRDERLKGWSEARINWNHVVANCLVSTESDSNRKEAAQRVARWCGRTGAASSDALVVDINNPDSVRDLQRAHAEGCAERLNETTSATPRRRSAARL